MTTETKSRIEDVLKELEDINAIDKEPVQTGLLPLDCIFSNGISNEVIQIAGDSGTSKTGIALQLSQIYCLQGKKVLYLNTQNSVNQDRLKSLGLDKCLNTQFFLFKAETFKKAEEILDKFIETDELDMIVVDSIANLINDGYLNLNHTGKSKGITIDNYNSNYDTRPLSLFIRKYSALSSSRHFSLVLVSAMRQKVHKTLGTIEKRFGPKSLDGCCSTIIKINKPKNTTFVKLFEKLRNGYPLELEVIKSNIISSNTKIPFYYEFGGGIKDFYNLVYYLLVNGIIKKESPQSAYYELSGTGIKVKGIEAMLNELNKYYDVLNKQYRNSMKEFYKSL